jgi:hypothetical protein
LIVDVHLQGNASSPGSLAHEGKRAVECCGEMERRQLQLHPPGLDLRQVEDIVDQGEEMLP